MNPNLPWRVKPAWLAAGLIAVIFGIVAMTVVFFTGALNSYVPVTLTSDRAGLVMETGAKVKMRGVQVGKVAGIAYRNGRVSLDLEIFPDQVKFIPDNVAAQIKATTTFGAKFVDLVYPGHPSSTTLRQGQVLVSQNVTAEVNTVFQNLVAVLHEVDPAKLNATLTALADALRGEGPAIGNATSDANQVLQALNSRAKTLRTDWRALRGFANTYSAAASSILSVLDAASTTSMTISSNAKSLDEVLLGVIGLSRSGTDLLGPNQNNLVASINELESTTSLLLKYNPELTCTLVGAKYYLDHGGSVAGGNGYSTVLDGALLLGDDPYRYPDNLPVIGAKGGPGGQPGCGSLPRVDQNFPARYVVTDTGWGTGVDMRPNPGIGFPGYANYFPYTRGTPEPPSIRHPGGPAPGPVPGTDGYDSPAPYGAPRYAPDGTPLFPGLPPAPPPGKPREIGPPPAGSEPFVPPAPAQMPPTYAFQPPPAPPAPVQPAP